MFCSFSIPANREQEEKKQFTCQSSAESAPILVTEYKQ